MPLRLGIVRELLCRHGHDVPQTESDEFPARGATGRAKVGEAGGRPLPCRRELGGFRMDVRLVKVLFLPLEKLGEHRFVDEEEPARPSAAQLVAHVFVRAQAVGEKAAVPV